MTSTTTAQWSSRIAFILAAIGCSVGLGNLWRFSAEAGANGGGAFIVIYLACVLFIGIPAIFAEFLIGRAGKASSGINSIRDLTQRSGVSGIWSAGVWAGIVSAFLIISFYAVVAAWVMAYIPRFLIGAFDGQTPSQIATQFDVMTSDSAGLIPWFLLFCGLVIWLVARGVNAGLEVASKILMPAFFVLLVLLSIYSMTSAWNSGGSIQALDFLFNPDFSKINGGVAVSALGQAFFSIGLGMAMMIAYASYLPDKISLPKSAFIIGLADTGVALIAGLAIFPIVFQYGLDFEAGAGLFFQTLPTALINSPGGNLVGAAFFCMGFFAALTTGVALLEPSVAHLAENTGMSKAKSSIIMGIPMILVGFICLTNMQFLDFLDTGLTAPILLPFSALMIVLFVGWRLDKAIIQGQLNDEDRKIGNFLMFFISYVAPIMITIILVAGVRDTYFT